MSTRLSSAVRKPAFRLFPPKGILLTLLAALTLGGCVAAHVPEPTCNDALRALPLREAVRACQTLANNGDTQAQEILARMARLARQPEAADPTISDAASEGLRQAWRFARERGALAKDALLEWLEK